MAMELRERGPVFPSRQSLNISCRSLNHYQTVPQGSFSSVVSWPQSSYSGSYSKGITMVVGHHSGGVEAAASSGSFLKDEVVFGWRSGVSRRCQISSGAHALRLED